MIKWIRGNSKLKKTSKGKYKVIGFGILADHNFTINGKTYNTCPGALACRGICYAKSGAYNFPNTIKARKQNLRESLKPNFVQTAIHDLKNFERHGVNVVRIHDSGDLYSQEYLDKWIAIAKAMPNMIFYSYTKSLNLDFSKAPKNFKVTQSIGGKYDKLVNLRKPHARIFATEEDVKKAKYPESVDSDIPAIEGQKKISLVYHGVKNLTEPQKEYFS